MSGIALEFFLRRLSKGEAGRPEDIGADVVSDVLLRPNPRDVPVGALGGCVDIDFGALVIGPKCDPGDDGIFGGGGDLSGEIENGGAVAAVVARRGELAIFEDVEPAHRHGRGIVCRGDRISGAIARGGSDGKALDIRAGTVGRIGEAGDRRSEAGAIDEAIDIDDGRLRGEGAASAGDHDRAVEVGENTGLILPSCHRRCFVERCRRGAGDDHLVRGIEFENAVPGSRWR